MALKVTKFDTPSVETTPSAWVEFKEGAKLEIYGANHPVYQTALERLRAGYIAQGVLELDEDSVNVDKELAVIGKYIVKNWEGFVDDKDEPLELTPANFVATVHAFPELHAFVFEKMYEIQNKHFEKIEKTKKK